MNHISRGLPRAAAPKTGAHMGEPGRSRLAERPATSGATETHEDRRRAAWRVVEMAAEDCEDARLITAPLRRLIVKLAAGADFCRTGTFVNALGVDDMADLLGRSPSTVRRQIRRLEEGGWVRDVTPGNGARGVVRGVRFGIDLSPLMRRAGEAAQAKADRKAAWDERTAARQRLKGLMGALRRRVRSALAVGVEAASNVANLLASVPRRFGQLPLEVLAKLAEAVERVLFSSEEKDGTDPGRAETRDGPGTDAGPHTDTSKDPSRRGAAGEKARGGNRSARNEEDGFAITPWEALRLVSPDAREEVTTVYGPGERGLWQGLGLMAQAAWHRAGGEARTHQRLLDALGPRPAAVLMLLMAGRGAEVRNPAAYATACARKALNGTFRWKAGVDEAVLNGRVAAIV